MATEDFNPFDFSNEYPIELPAEAAVSPIRIPERAPQTEAPRGHNHTNLRMAYEYFLDKGLAPHQAAAIAGNIAQESGGHSRAEGGGKIANDPYSLGFAQWNRDRLLGLQNFAAAQGTHVSDPRVQLDYMWHELNGSEKGALKALLASNNLEDATHAFGAAYERPNEKYANYAGRVNYARNILQNAQANEAMGGGHPDAGPMRTISVFDHDENRARQLAVPEQVADEDAIAALQAYGKKIEKLNAYPLTNGQTLQLPASVNVNDALVKLQARDPNQEWMTQQHAERTGLVPAAVAAVKSILPTAQQGMGEIMQEFGPTKELGEQWRKQGLSDLEAVQKGVEEPLPTDPWYKRAGHPTGAVLGNVAAIAPAAAISMVAPEAAALVGLSTVPLAAGSLGQRFEEKGEDMSLADPANAATVIGESVAQMLPGVKALRPVAGEMVKSAIKGTVATGVPDVASVIAERAAAGQSLTDEEAQKEYAMTALGDLIGGGGAGAYMGRAGAAPKTPPAGPEVKGAKPGEGGLRPELAPTEGTNETLEDIVAEVGKEKPLPPMPEMPPEAPQLPAPEGIAPTPEMPTPEMPVPEMPPAGMPPMGAQPEMPPAEAPPMGAQPEMPPAPVGEEPPIPQPTVRTKEAPARHELAEILDLPFRNDKRSLYQKLAQLDVRNNPEHIDAAHELLNKSAITGSLDPERLNNFHNFLEEMRNAYQKQGPATPDVGGGSQPEVFQEGEGPAVGGQGIRGSGQEGGAPEVGGIGGKPPEEVAHPGARIKEQWANHFQLMFDDYVERNPTKFDHPRAQHFKNAVAQINELPPEAFIRPDGTPTPIETILKYDSTGGAAPVPPKAPPEAPPEAPPKPKAPEIELPEAPTEELPEAKTREQFAQRLNIEHVPNRWIESAPNKTLAEAIRRKDTNGALDVLAQSSNPFHRHIAQHARRISKMLVQEKRLGPNEAGEFNYLTRTLSMAPQFADSTDTFAHEVTHAMLGHAIHHPTPEQQPHVRNLEELFNSIRSHPLMKVRPEMPKTRKKMYGMTSVSEFVSEGLSNPEFQHRLSQIRMGKQNAWTKFTDVVAKILGLKHSTALTEFLHHTDQLLDVAHRGEVIRTLSGHPVETTKARPKRSEVETAIREIHSDAERHADTAEAQRHGWWDKLQDKTRVDWSNLYTKFRKEAISHQAELEEILGKQEMWGPTGEIRAKAKMGQSTHVGNLVGESYREGYIKRNERGLNEVVHDSRLSLEKWREDFSALPDELREKFADAINTLAMHGHNTRYNEHMAIFRDNDEQLTNARAYRKELSRLAGKMQQRGVGSRELFGDIIKTMDDLDKTISKREKLASRLKDRYKNVRQEDGRIFDVSDAQAAEARRVINSSPETKDLAARLRESLKKDAELLRDNQVISENTFKSFTDPKYDYAPRYMQMEDLEQIFPDIGAYPSGGGQRRVATPKKLRGGQHEVNLLENLFQHRAKMAANAIHNNARLGTLQTLTELGAATKLPANSPPSARIKAVAVMEDGKRQYYEVHDQGLYEAFEILHHMPIPIWTPLTKGISRTMLVNPGYWYRQMAREPFMAAVSTGMGLKHSVSMPFDTARTFAALLMNKAGEDHAIYSELKSKGVTASHDYITGRIKEELKDVIKPPATKVEAATKYAKDVGSVAMKIHEYADAATKVATMRRLIKMAESGEMTGKPMSHAQAREAAIVKVGEMLNLQARGRSGFVNYLNNTTPFFNTYLQGIDAIVRNASGHGMTEHEAKMARQSMRNHLLALTAFSTASAIGLGLSSEAYRKAKPDDLLNNWVLPVGDGKHLLKASAPFEFTVAKAIPEMIVRHAMGLDRGEDVAGQVSDQLWRNIAPPGFESLGIPFLAKPLAEAMMNSSINYMRGDIHPLAAPGIAPEVRGRGQYAFSDAVSNVTGISPATITHIVQGYGPELMQAINSTTNLTSALIGSTFGKKGGKDIARDITETVPLLHDFMTNPNRMDAGVRDFAQEQKMYKTTGKYMQRRGMEGSKEYLKKGQYSVAAGRLDNVISGLDAQLARIKNKTEFKDAQEAELYAKKYEQTLQKKEKALAKEKEFKEKIERKQAEKD